MADTKYPTNLYDANGQQVGAVEHEDDLSQAAAKDGVIESGGKTYVWNQRNNQWREATNVHKIGRAEQVKTETKS